MISVDSTSGESIVELKFDVGDPTGSERMLPRRGLADTDFV
jgi:hypothetical protein